MIKKIDFYGYKSAYLVTTNYTSYDQYFEINNKKYFVKAFDKIIFNIDNTLENNIVIYKNLDIQIKKVIDREYYEINNQNIVPLQFGMFSLDEIRKARKNNKLLSLWINLSNICNLKCKYCFNSAGEKLINELTKEEIKNMCLQAKELGCKKIVIVGSGEPLLDLNFKSIIKYINELEMETVLFTNGLLINNDICELLLQNNIKVCLKFHSFNIETSNFLIGKSATKYILNALDLLVKYNFHKLNQLSLANQIFKQNINDIPEVYRYCRDNDIIPRVSKILFKGKGKICTELYPSNEEVNYIFKTLKEIDNKEYSLQWGNFNNNVYAGDQGCQLCYINLFVDVFGNVQPCIGILNILGNIKNKFLKDMWEENKLKNIDINLNGPCTKCKKHQIYSCYGCAGRNHLENNNELNSRICGNFIKGD